MNVLGFAAVLFILCLLGYDFFEVFRKPRKSFEYPFLVSATFSAIILPTLLANVTSDRFIAFEDFSRMACFFCLCLFVGRVAYSSRGLQGRRFQLPDKMKGGNLLGLTLIPILAISLYAQVHVNPTEYGSVLGGAFAIWLFLARLTRPILVISWCGYLSTRSRWCLAVFGMSLLATLPFIIISGRRSDALFVPFGVLAPLWCIRGIALSRMQLIVGFTLAILIFFLFPVMRKFTRDFDFASIGTIDFSESLQAAVSGERTNEVVELAKDMSAVARTGQYSFGAEFVNKFVHQYVSATLFGNELKQSLLLRQPDIAEMRFRASSQRVAYLDSRFYLTRFGFGEAFLCFGWFGCLNFGVLALCCRRLYRYCIVSTDPRRRILYCIIILLVPYSVYDSISGGLVFTFAWLVVFWLVVYCIPRYSRGFRGRIRRIRGGLPAIEKESTAST